MNNLNELIKFIYDTRHNEVSIDFDDKFGDKNQVIKLVNKLQRHRIVYTNSELLQYSCIKVKKLDNLSLIIDEFDCDFEKYLEAINKKEHLEIDNLEFNKIIRDKDLKIKKLTISNLKLQNWDIRFRWLIASISFILGILLKLLLTTLNILP